MFFRLFPGMFRVFSVCFPGCSGVFRRQVLDFPGKRRYISVKKV